MPRSLTRPALLALAAPVAGAIAVVGLSIAPDAHAAAGLPTPAHVVVVMEENHSYDEIVGSSSAPYINSLAAQGALFSQSFAVTHPSQPNYVELFSGSTQGLTGDSCPHTYSAANLGSELIAAGKSFGGYSEGLPSDGSKACTSGSYARKHVPWANFSNVPAADSRTFTEFPSDYATLPTVSFVIPNLLDDMHDGTIQQGDTWLQNNLGSYAQWAKTNNSLLIVTWDEDDSSASNQIPTLIVGQGVTPGTYTERITHDGVLRTLEDFYNLPHAGNSAGASPITDIFAASSGGSGSASPTPSSSASASASASTSPTPSSSASSTGCAAAQLLGNPGFETGTASPWTASSGVVNSDTSSEPANSGSWDAWLDGYGSTHTDTLAQTVAIPASCATATLSYWLHVDTAETTATAAHDTLRLQALNASGTVLATLASHSNLDADTGYTQHSVDLSAYVGQSITLKFTGTENSSLQTSFVLDDTALNVS